MNTQILMVKLLRSVLKHLQIKQLSMDKKKLNGEI